MPRTTYEERLNRAHARRRTPRATFGLPLMSAGAAATVSPSVQMDHKMGMMFQVCLLELWRGRSDCNTSAAVLGKIGRTTTSALTTAGAHDDEA